MSDSRLDDALRRHRSMDAPASATLELTYACNWRCVFCYNPRHSDLEGLQAIDWHRILSQLRALGVMNVSLTGGEPLAHPGFLSILRSARSQGFVVRIQTNGSLIDEALAAEIALLHVACVEMSLHGDDAETHDSITKRPGSFDAVLRAVGLLESKSVPILLKSPICSLNESRFDAIVELARRLAVPISMSANITPRDDGELSPLEFRPGIEAQRRVLQLGLETGSLTQPARREGDANCGIGTAGLVIDPEGNVFACAKWRHRSLGNVRDSSLLEIWKGSTVREETRQIAIQANDMLLEDPATLALAAYCPAVAFRITGDALVPPAEFRENARVAAEVWTSAPDRSTS